MLARKATVKNSGCPSRSLSGPEKNPENVLASETTDGRHGKVRRREGAPAALHHEDVGARHPQPADELLDDDDGDDRLQVWLPDGHPDVERDRQVLRVDERHQRSRSRPYRAASAPPMMTPTIELMRPRPLRMPRWTVSTPRSRSSGFDIANIMMSPSR